MDEYLELAKISPSERILLLPHCLRRSDGCRATYNQQGLQCASCNPDCSINKLRAMALECGYKSVCVAPGGRLAIKLVKEARPRAIVAVGCDKELEEGLRGVKELAEEGIVPLVIIVPLLKDGCVDTEIDDEKVLEIIATGRIS